MKGWLKITLVAVSCGTILSLLLIMIIQKTCNRKRRRDRFEEGSPEIAENAHSAAAAGITQLQHVSLHHLDRNGTGKINYFVFRRGPSAKPNFSWADHPSLVADAVDNGWANFGFTAHTPPPPPARSARSLLGACGAADIHPAVKISWEVSPGSSDLVQKIKFRCNSDHMKRISSIRNKSPVMTAASVLKTSLPLPGPQLGTSSFPQEAYFEITILPCDEDEDEGRRSQDDKINLIREDYNAKSAVHAMSNREDNGKGNRKHNNSNHVAISIGLSGSGCLPFRLPGSYPGSIGFHSNGSVCLDGMVLVYEGEPWGRTEEKVIGCGYNPSQKKVIFTVDSLLMHEIKCKSEEFGSPLYPTIAANADITVVVNHGQSVFKYGPANMGRTSNPSFSGPLSNNSTSAIGYDEDSKELFSIGRIESLQWLNRNTTAARTYSNGVKQQPESDLESDGELFEIMLDGYGKKPQHSTATL
ncbi:unnamed protein product [Cuscuta epithymum]|uniref:SPRY domain-containing protein n=1 Tax=Cuscuta epithymum TaxID=186058 RepID=A0AAV0DLM1_9ASTE|nr:unnamed protein product [Cuscuta epithymum]